MKNSELIKSARYAQSISRKMDDGYISRIIGLLADALEDQDWQSADTAPENGEEFLYYSGFTYRIGSLGHDLGGSIKRDPNMIAWKRLTRPETKA